MKKTAPAKYPYDPAHERRIAWWRDARFGMFIHWGAYAVHGRGEWAMNVEQIPVKEYEKYADAFKPRPNAPRAWAKLAAEAGMKYMVMTAKHHEGYCLWDSKLTNFNSVKRGCGRDLVAEYVAAAREYGMKVGLYYSLMDWHHPDGARCIENKGAYKRFIDFTHGCVRELMSNYGKIDILWYDLSWPFMKIEEWQSVKLNAMARKLQPEILINDRSLTPEDFDTGSEGHVKGGLPQGRDWEACMTTTGSWGYAARAKPSQYSTPAGILDTLRAVTAGAGNLLLNIGPDAKGNVPGPAEKALRDVGAWMKKYGAEVVYGHVDRVQGTGLRDSYTRKGDCHYMWLFNWTPFERSIGRIRTRVKDITLIPGNKKLPFTQTYDRLLIKGLPEKNPDETVGVPLLKIRFAGNPRQDFAIGLKTMAFERKAAKAAAKKK
ncbi:MAG: alpha-L-fucosidase [Planctomycetaceae bacterium]|nr:alpha-L-fucosidase [Planctomycetaceae bacterium]